MVPVAINALKDATLRIPRRGSRVNQSFGKSERKP
jgi:hypothetical protein